MPRRNVIFIIVAPIVLMAIIAATVIGIGEILLTVHHWASEMYHVGSWPTAEENRHWKEMAGLYSTFVALAIASVILIGGILASWLAPSQPV